MTAEIVKLAVEGGASLLALLILHQMSEKLGRIAARLDMLQPDAKERAE